MSSLTLKGKPSEQAPVATATSSTTLTSSASTPSFGMASVHSLRFVECVSQKPLVDGDTSPVIICLHKLELVLVMVNFITNTVMHEWFVLGLTFVESY